MLVANERINLCCGRSVAVLIGTFASVVTLTGVTWFLQSGRLLFP
jgi:hypothetical protein